MVTFSLQSGSNGNAIYVEAGDTRLVFDAGISAKLAEGRMADRHRTLNDADALIISHEHSDHIRCAGIYQRKFGLPIYMTAPTHRANRTKLGQIDDVRYFRSGDTLTFGSVRVHTIATEHDAADGVAFVVEHDGKRLGILTDLGHVFDGLQHLLASLDAAYLESNYDPDLLDRGPYPIHLKQRIRGNGGHLSNGEAAGLLKGCGRDRPNWVAVAHLSQDNNHPRLAVGAHHAAVGKTYRVNVAPREAASELMEV